MVKFNDFNNTNIRRFNYDEENNRIYDNFDQP